MMAMVHRAFERDAARLRDAVQAAPGDPARVAAVAALWELFLALLEHHHQAEDRVLWPTLLEVDPGSAEHVAQMESQHSDLDGLLHRADAAMDAWSADPGAPDTAAAAAEQLQGIVDLLDTHLADEERTVLPLVEQELTVEQWMTFTGYNMQLNAGIGWTVPWLAEGQPAQVRAGIWAIVPADWAAAEGVGQARDYAATVALAFDVPAPSVLPG